MLTSSSATPSRARTNRRARKAALPLPSRPAPEPSADRPVDQFPCEPWFHPPAAEEPGEHLTAVPVPAAAAAGAVDHVQDQVAGGAFPQDPLVLDGRHVQGVRVEPPGEALRPLAPLAQRGGDAGDRLLRGGDRMHRAAPVPDRPAVEVPFVVRPAPAHGPDAVAPDEGVRHGVGPGFGLAPAPGSRLWAVGGDAGPGRHPPGERQRFDLPHRRRTVEGVAGGVHLVPAQRTGRQIAYHRARLPRAGGTWSSELTPAAVRGTGHHPVPARRFSRGSAAG